VLPDQPPRPLLEVFAERLAATREARPAGTHQHGAWQVPATPGSGYQRLLAALADQADAGTPPGADGTVHITDALLDRLGAPPCTLRWPVDCVIRKLGGGRTVLHDTGPAGVLDARFTEALAWLHGRVPQADAYREFLARLDRRTGIRSVELLLPPVSERAANAVRRPLYAGAWTGDSDPAGYSAAGLDARHALDYLPLAALTVRRDDGQAAVEYQGRPVRVLCHATHRAKYPWHLISGLLLAGSPQRGLRDCRLRWSLPAFGGRAFFPRITLAGSVVISAAQWRVTAAECWDPDAPLIERVRRLVRLRDRRGLPRWVFAAAGPAAGAQPCDLDSLRAISTLELALAGSGQFLAEEMLPPPAELGVADLSGEPAGRVPGDLVASELLIRLPASVSAAAAPMTSLRPESWKGGEADDEGA
jgi:hypothetical protein